MIAPTIEARFNDRQLAAIERAIKRFGFSKSEAQHFFHILYTASYEEAEILICGGDPQYFITEYCLIYEPQQFDWIPFELWPEQIHALNLLHDHQFTIALKARQLGLTWLALAYGLWLMLFRPIATILLFSKRDDESAYLLGEERLRGMYRRLPKWMQCESETIDNVTHWALSNGSTAYSFPTTGGDSYTATYVLIDEADLIPDFNRLMRSVSPTIDTGGKLFLVSRADKNKPESEFKRIYKAAKEGKNDYASIFLPWHIRPERDQAWYDAKQKSLFEQTGSDDDLHEQYPATDVEALAGRSKDKRIPEIWLQQCYAPMDALSLALLRNEKAPGIPGLLVFRLPILGRKYVLGADPAEGNPTSDDSAASVLDDLTGEEVALLSGKFEPSTFGSHIDKVGTWFNRARVLVERNNHGHAVLLWLRDNSRLRRLPGWDSQPQDRERKDGWLSNSRGKTLLYDGMADAARDKLTIIHSFKVFNQLASIDGSTLRAPELQMDDCSDAYALAVAARNMPTGVLVG